MRGVQRMIDEDRWCPDVLIQVAAIQAALDKVALGLAEDHARHCVMGEADGEREARTQELMARHGTLDATRLKSARPTSGCASAPARLEAPRPAPPAARLRPGASPRAAHGRSPHRA